MFSYIYRLQERLAEVRKKKALEEEQQAREREINRRKSGQDAIKAKEAWKEAQAKREQEALKREKEADIKARERLRKKIEQDKLERAAKYVC